jgi:hypothetical protein
MAALICLLFLHYERSIGPRQRLLCRTSIGGRVSERVLAPKLCQCNIGQSNGNKTGSVALSV